MLGVGGGHAARLAQGTRHFHHDSPCLAIGIELFIRVLVAANIGGSDHLSISPPAPFRGGAEEGELKPPILKSIPFDSEPPSARADRATRTRNRVPVRVDIICMTGARRYRQNS